MSENIPREVLLKQKQFEYLQAIAEKYKHVDSSKALRCLINYAIDSPDVEAKIFGEIRCMDC